MKLYLIFKNSDMNEGRGPMVLDSIFLSEKNAKNYIDDMPGVMGRKAKWSQQKHGDWEIRKVNTVD